MGWEFRLFVPLPPGPVQAAPAPAWGRVPPAQGAPATCGGAPDLFAVWRPHRSVPPEERADIYLPVGDEGVGAKLRDVDGHGNGTSELKLREEVEKRGAERWTKVRSHWGCRRRAAADPTEAAARLLRSAGRAAAASAIMAQAGPRVRLDKRRWQGLLPGGVVAEQTELTIAVAPARPGPEGLRWHTLPCRYRTICFEGPPRTGRRTT